ncbi:MAG: DedA family protein [Proteobacteria bacterium]|nr:DedA family protein [Pseudomonadota bacterium]
MFEALKNRTLGIIRSPHAERGLFVLAFAESSFFPIPPDVVLGPMAAARPGKWMRFAFICATGSVLGAILGYAIGYFAAETLGRWILQIFGLSAAFEHFRANSLSVMPWVILGQGLIPVPYKLVTIASGMLRISLLLLIGCSILTRFTRFFAVAYVFKRYGPSIAPVIEKRIGLTLAIGAVLLALLIAAYVLLMHS